MKNCKKYKHKKNETKQKRGNGITYSKPDSRPFFAFFTKNKLFQVNNWSELPEGRQTHKALAVVDSMSQWGNFYMK